MIIYKDIFTKLKEAGYTTTKIRQDKLISESTLTRIRSGMPINLAAIDMICKLTKLPIQEIIEYIDDDEDKNENL